MSNKSFFTEKIKKINGFVEKNSWVNFFSRLLSLKEIVIWVWKMLVWVYKKIFYQFVEEIWKRAKEMNWTWNKGVIFLALTFLLLIFVVCMFRKETKPKRDLTHFGRLVNDIIEKLKRRRGGDLNNSVLLYQVGSHKYGYNKLDKSRQKEVYWLFRTNQEDEWSEKEVIREELVD